MELDGEVLPWLLDTDPALRWQVERDLASEPPDVWEATRARVASEGFGATLLGLQDADGQWDGGAFFPGGLAFMDTPEASEPGQPWTATSWSLTALRDWGVEAAALGDTAARIAANSRWEYDDLPYWGGEVDCCINAATLANGAWLGLDMSALVDWFAAHRQADGGWNCEWVEGSTRSSFHSTLNSVIGLLEFETRAESASPEQKQAARTLRHSGEQYLLDRHLLHRLGDGVLVGDWVTAFIHPFRWQYSALRAADHFRAAARLEGVGQDARLGQAVDLIRTARQPDGTWLQEGRHAGRAWFEVDVAPGQPSPWLTFYASRVLGWWDGAEASA